MTHDIAQRGLVGTGSDQLRHSCFELFGGNGAIVFAVACVIAYSTSGHKGIYHAQPVAAHKSGVRGNP